MAVLKNPKLKKWRIRASQFVSNSSSRNLLFWFLVVSLVPTSIVGYIGYDAGRQMIEEMSLLHLSHVAVMAHDRIDVMITDIILSTHAAQSSYNIKQNLPILEKFSNDTSNKVFVDGVKMLDAQLVSLQISSHYLDVELVDSKGRIVYASNKGHASREFLVSVDEDYPGIFEAGKKGIFFSDIVSYSEVEGKPSMIVAAPVYGTKNEFIGLFMARFDASFFFDWGTFGNWLGESGEIRFTKKIGDEVEYFNLPRSTGVIRAGRIKIGRPIGLATQYSVTGKAGFGRVIDYRGEKVIAAWEYLNELNWGMVIQMDEGEVFKPVYVLRNYVAIVLLLSLVIILVASYFVRNSIVSPITAIIAAAEKIKRGDYNIKLDVKTSDELGVLAATVTNAAKALANLAEERVELDHAKNQFLSVSSHELRSPMTPIQAQIQMLSAGYFGMLNKKQKDAVDIIARNSKKLDTVIQEMLEISRISTAKLMFNFTKVNIKNCVSRAVEDVEEYLPAKKIQIITKVGRLPVIEADADRIIQVLKNLLMNAKQFSYPGSKVFVSAALLKKEIVFSVRDFGIGISDKYKSRIYEPFFQGTKSAELGGGTFGLGLSICKGLVEAQNGRIWFESEEGKGAVFYFTIPLSPVKVLKPLASLFYSHSEFEAKINGLFVNYLGPLGQREFELLQEKGVTPIEVRKYVARLFRENIISSETYAAMKSEIEIICHHVSHAR